MENDKHSILIVDDTPKNLQVLGNTLKLQNYKVEFAINGFKALEWIEKQEFDLVLLDVMMPEMDGYEVCTKIRENEKYNNLPIIFLTAKTDSESIVNGFKLGAQDYITKPFNTSELLIRVETQLELKSSREKLESVNKWLEDEVKKRTIEIEQANKNLAAANKELVGLDKAKTDFLAIISNEMRSPLNGIMGTLHILKDQVDSRDLVELIGVLDSSVNKLEKFSSYALLITGLKTKKYKLNIQNIKVSSLIEFCLIELSKTIKEQKVKIENNISFNDEIKGDYDLMVKAISKIIENALIRTPQNGNIQLNVKNTDGYLIIEVKDQSEGFSPDFLDQNFELMKSDDSSYDELGLDLNLVKLIMEAHQGKIELENKSDGASINILIKK